MGYFASAAFTSKGSGTSCRIELAILLIRASSLPLAPPEELL